MLLPLEAALAWLSTWGGGQVLPVEGTVVLPASSLFPSPTYSTHPAATGTHLGQITLTVGVGLVRRLIVDVVHRSEEVQALGSAEFAMLCAGGAQRVKDLL